MKNITSFKKNIKIRSRSKVFFRCKNFKNTYLVLDILGVAKSFLVS